MEDQSFESLPPTPETSQPHRLADRHISLDVRSPPELRLNTSFPAPHSPTSPTSPSSPWRPRRATLARSKPVTGPASGLSGNQKLLSHLLDQLESRDVPPDLLDRAALGAKGLHGNTKGKGKAKFLRPAGAVAAIQQGLLKKEPGPSKASMPTGISSEDLEDRLVLEEGDWVTDSTVDLVNQVLDVFRLAQINQQDLFGSTAFIDDAFQPTPDKSKRKHGRFASLASPVTPSKPRMPESGFSGTAYSTPRASLLTRSIEMLRSIVTVDCLHKTHHFGPATPPQSLQVIALNIATYLYDKSSVESQVTIVDIVVEGLYCMEDGMMERTCAWLEGRLGELLNRVAKERGEDKAELRPLLSDPFAPTKASNGLPTFALSGDPADPNGDTQAQGWLQYSPQDGSHPLLGSEGNIAGVLSSHGLGEAVSALVLRVSATVRSILLAVSSTFDLASSSLTTMFRVQRLINVVLCAKSDAAVDLLEIIAHGPPRARRMAAELLSTFYPETSGHNLIARRLALSTYAAHRARWETGQDQALGEDKTDGHHFVPWRISSKDGTSDLQTACSTCDKDIRGFALRCTLCGDVQHLQCYREYENQFKLSVAYLSETKSTDSTVTIRFSRRPPRLDERWLSPALGSDNLGLATRVKVGGHELVLVNLFDLALCAECHEPLWGSHAQAYACAAGCQQLFHPGCLQQLAKGNNGQCHSTGSPLVDDVASPAEDPFTIRLKDVRVSFESVENTLVLRPDDMRKHSYDEVAILYGRLWVQYQVFKNGMASGSLRILADSSSATEHDVLGMRGTLRSYEDYLDQNGDKSSSAARDFAEVCGSAAPLGTGCMFSCRFLTYCAALLRSPSVPDKSPRMTATDRLSPFPSPDPSTAGWQDVERTGKPASYETLQLPVLFKGMAGDLNVKDARVAALLADQLLQSGLITSTGRNEITESQMLDRQVSCAFGLPLLVDASPTVELLILAIEELLSSVDLALNEQAMLLLVNRAWPSYLCSPFAIERLAASVIQWLMSQDTTLHQVVSQYASKHRRMPGVRMTGGKGSSAVAMYQQDRAKLVARYIRPWLSAVHDLDSEAFASIVYDRCKDTPLSSNAKDRSNAATMMAAQTIERLTTMLDSSCIFSSSLDVLTAWLEDLGTLADQDIAYRSLPRLMRHRAVQSTSEDEHEGFWSLARATMALGVAGHQRVCRWVRVLASSGITIPWDILSGLVDTQTSLSVSLKAKLELVIALSSSTEQIEISHGRFADVCAQQLMNVTSELIGQSLRQPTEDEKDLLRRALLLILRAYGVSDNDIAESALGIGYVASATSPGSLAKKRRVTTDPLGALSLDEDVVRSVAAILRLGMYPPAQLLDFFWLMFSKVSLVANVDGFIFAICSSLSPVLWNLMDSHQNRPNLLRVLLRVLSVNTAPILELARADLEGDQRSAAMERIFGLILNMADTRLTSEVLGWRNAAVDTILLFFEMVSKPEDSRPENHVLIRGLMPHHLLAMSACFEEALTRTSPENRINLLGRLQRLRAVRPDWQILSWETIDTLLSEAKTDITALQLGTTEQNRSARHDALLVRAHLLAIGLDILACGLPISWDIAQRFQQHVAAACALPWPKTHEPVTAVILPQLRAVLDACQHLSNINGPDTKSKRRVLVGTLYVPVMMDFAMELGKRDIIVDKLILDIFMVTVFKHDLGRVELPALAALRLLADFVGTTESSELALLALQILRTAMENMSRESFNRAAPGVFSTLSDRLICSIDRDGDSAVIQQIMALLRSIGVIFGRAGLFNGVMALPIDSGSNRGVTLGRTLQILHDRATPVDDSSDSDMLFDSLVGALPNMLKNRQNLQHVLQHFSYACMNYQREVSESAAEHFGAFLGRLTKAVAELNAADFDPNPSLRAAAAVLPMVPKTAMAPLCSQMATMLNMAFGRFDVDSTTVNAVLGVAIQQQPQNDAQDVNPVRAACLETANAVLHGAASTLTTLHALLAVLLDGIAPRGAIERNSEALHMLSIIQTSVSGCIGILLGHNRILPSLRGDPATDIITIRTLAAKLLLLAETGQPGTISRCFDVVQHEAGAVRLSPFTHLALAALDGRDARTLRGFIPLLPIASRATALCLRGSADLLAVEDVAGQGAELLSLVYVTIRLIYLLPSIEGAATDVQEAVGLFWDRTWPDWHRYLSLSFESGCVNAPLRAVAHSVFLDMVIFLYVSGSTLLLQEARVLGQALEWLGNYFESSNAGAASLAKLQKATTALETRTSGGVRSNVGALVRAIETDLRATEKLRVLRNAQHFP